MLSRSRMQERDLLLFVFNEKQPATAGFAEFTLDGSTLLTGRLDAARRP
jgi:hypothetical protein